MTNPEAAALGVLDGKLFDKTGREIMVGDVLKVFHYVAAHRGRHCFMFKQVEEIVTLGKSGALFLKISHLDFGKSGSYHEWLNGRVMRDYEIVQGAKDDFYDRSRIASLAQGGFATDGAERASSPSIAVGGYAGDSVNKSSMGPAQKGAGN